MKKILLALILVALSLACHAPEYRSLCIFPAEATYYIRPDEVMKRIKEAKIRFPSIVWRQVMLETCWISSPLALKGRNLFGMKHTGRGYSRGALWGHASYASYEDSIRDYKEWQDRYYRGGDYYEFLTRIGYAEDEEYIAKLKRIN